MDLLEGEDEFYSFLEETFYPFLVANKYNEEIKNIRFLISTISEDDGQRVIREAKSNQVVWLSASRQGVLSKGFVRILESSPVNLSPFIGSLLPSIPSLDDYFTKDRIDKLANKCTNLEELKKLKELLEFYGYKLEIKKKK
ncbi:hypothetical protein P261_00025 [Lachnospiraceae bacterium TWA4]|nr:hypothetical protein P261_00025 [Lachnospiraceae bacterium TWA4]